MPRRLPLLALCAALLSCQDYRFNPVGICTIQPGQKRIALEGFTTADILFVVDDSGSMDPMQQNLANNFNAFITQLAATQAERAGRGLEPLDFHIAVTTSSVFVNEPGQCSGSPAACALTPPFPVPSASTACSASGNPCSGIVDRFYDVGNGCTAGVAVNGAPYPAGSFVAAAGNPKVIHFTKALNWTGGAADPTIAPLITQFRNNVQVGSCGSPAEQHLEAGRLAVQKALAGQQGVGAGEWPHGNAKMVLVWIGNEDDCSMPKDPVLAPLYSGGPGADMCTVAPAHLVPVPGLTSISSMAGYFAGLGRPLGAAFIRPGDTGCDNIGGNGTGYSPGTRFKAMAQSFRDLGSSVVEGSICSPSFATTLSQIADLVKPLEALKLPSQPAAGIVTLLRIVDGAGKTVHTCAGPASGQEWWFVASGANGSCTTTPTGGSGSDPSPCVIIQKGSACEAAPGQTYVAEYLGQVPASGCNTVAGGAAQCATALGGDASAWLCEPVPGRTAGAGAGTCLCAP
jgi:hypothetical protein